MELRPDNINVNSVMPGLTTSVMSETFLGSLGDERSAFTEVARNRYGPEIADR